MAEEREHPLTTKRMLAALTIIAAGAGVGITLITTGTFIFGTLLCLAGAIATVAIYYNDLRAIRLRVLVSWGADGGAITDPVKWELFIAMALIAVCVLAPIWLFMNIENNNSYALVQRDLAQIKASKWSPLTISEIDMLKSRLSKIEPEPVTIACETPNCKELAESFADAFRGGGWNDAKTYYGGGIGVSGATGLTIVPGDERTTAIITAIEEIASLKVRPPAYDRRQVQADPGIFFVIGTKPF